MFTIFITLLILFLFGFLIWFCNKEFSYDESESNSTTGDDPFLECLGAFLPLITSIKKL